MQSARGARMAPLAIAQAIAAHMAIDGPVGQVGVAPPGFLNITLDEAWLARQVAVIRAAGPAYADFDQGGGRRVQVEFVSANPTGPLHFGGARNAAIGDTLARALEASGYAVQREYYLNDSGTQIGKFGATLHARYCQLLGRDVEVPDDAYPGEYMRDYAARILETEGERFLEMDPEAAAPEMARLGIGIVRDYMEAVLGKIDVRFDHWFSEQSLYDSGLAAKIFAELEERGLTAQRDGATWLLTSEFGSDRDEVLIRSNGQPGYYASDVVYHYDKFVGRGFESVIDVWAVDHQNQARRMPFLMQALGLDPARLDILLYDLVKLVETTEDPTTGEPVKREIKMSKRLGTFIALEELLEDIAPDALRFMMLSRSNEQAIELDLELAKARTSDNPVYYVQYAHARICSILELAGQRGMADFDGADASLLTHPQEMALIRRMLRLSETIAEVVTFRAPHHLPHYAQDLARSFHAFYHDCQVLDPEAPDLSRARLALVDAARISLARVLDLMGMSAPESM
jgi:arginyl-tRNA synthetase